MQIKDYVKPELLVVAVVLYFVGAWLKQSETVKDKYIPLINGGIGIVICAIYVFATCACANSQDIALAVFTAITQGILVAGLSTYVNQLLKQSGKEDLEEVIPLSPVTVRDMAVATSQQLGGDILPGFLLIGEERKL